MQTIKLIETKEKVLLNYKAVEMTFVTSDLIRTVVNQPIKGGFSASDMVSRIRIIDRLAAAESELIVPDSEKTLDLEDADYKALSTMVAETRWPVVSKTILAFVDSFKK